MANWRRRLTGVGGRAGELELHHLSDGRRGNAHTVHRTSGKRDQLLRHRPKKPCARPSRTGQTSQFDASCGEPRSLSWILKA